MAGLSPLPAEAKRIDSEPLSTQVYRAIRDAICDGTLDEHTHLVQNQLAEQLQVSRTPVRDALLQLSQEGVVKAVGARGFLVEDLTPRDILDVYEIRLSLEVSAAVAAVAQVRSSDIRRLEELNESIAQAGDQIERAYELNQEFHSLLVDLSPNRLVKRILNDLWDLPVSRRVFQRHLTKSFDAEAMADGHKAIITAVNERNAEALRNALTAHLLEARDEAGAWIVADEADRARS
jgi:DNA-binding GntR family transcriptional regulator